MTDGAATRDPHVGGPDGKPLVSSVPAIQPLDLPPPRMEGGAPLMQALKHRHSTREFSTQSLPARVLSDLLWAAFGVNRPNGDSTPSKSKTWCPSTPSSIGNLGAAIGSASSKTPISFMKGAKEVARAFEEALGISLGETSADGAFTLEWTSDIGMADQEPAASDQRDDPDRAHAGRRAAHRRRAAATRMTATCLPTRRMRAGATLPKATVGRAS
jgi:hypothetical protein